MGQIYLNRWQNFPRPDDVVFPDFVSGEISGVGQCCAPWAIYSQFDSDKWYLLVNKEEDNPYKCRVVCSQPKGIYLCINLYIEVG